MSLQYHYRPQKGWVNDPNGLVWFRGYYHVFYQHAPDFEQPWKQPMHWGHARTKDFLHWEELPVALYPDKDYDAKGCWSGTAVVKDDTLYLFYASIDEKQTVSVAYSTDGIHFQKYEHNPVIGGYPADGRPDFRDPAVCRIGDAYYLVMATGHEDTKTARLLLYKSQDLFHWDYEGILCQWENSKYAECPSLVPTGDGMFLLTASVLPLGDDAHPWFSVMYGSFRDGKFQVETSAQPDKGPDQYAGQVFHGPKGRNIILSWMPGWAYAGYRETDIGCMSAPRELRVEDGKILCLPVEELAPYLRSEDPAVQRTETGFVIQRTGRTPVVYEGTVSDLRILRDGDYVEVFVNHGEAVYTALL